MLLDQQYKTLSIVCAASDSLDGKLTALLGFSGAVTGLLGLAGFKLEPGMVLDPRLTTALFAALLIFAAMVCLVLAAWSPKEFSALGSDSWATVHGSIVHQDADNAFRQVLSEVMGAVADTKCVNYRKALAIRQCAALVILQLVLIAVVVVASAGASIVAAGSESLTPTPTSGILPPSTTPNSMLR